jgi:hypothetical protein
MDLVNELARTDDALIDSLDGQTCNMRGRTTATPLTLTYVRDLTEADLALLAGGARAVSVRERIESLTHRHHLAARMIADGMKLSDVAYATAYSATTIANLRKDPAFRDLLAYYHGQKEQVYLDVHQRLGSLGMAAVDKLQSRIEHLDRLGEDELDDAQEEARRKIMPNGTLLQIAEMALDRSIAPAKGNGNAGVRDPRDIGGGLVVNLNFAEQGPSKANKVVDVTPTTQGEPSS